MGVSVSHAGGMADAPDLSHIAVVDAQPCIPGCKEPAMSPTLPDLPAVISRLSALELGITDEDSFPLLAIPLPDVMAISFEDWAAAVEAFQR